MTSDYQASSNNGKLWTPNPSVVCYHGGGSYISKNGSEIKQVTKWKPGDIMTIHLDCDNWKIKFVLNDTQNVTELATIDLDSNTRYYPGLSMYSIYADEFNLLP